MRKMVLAIVLGVSSLSVNAQDVYNTPVPQNISSLYDNPKEEETRKVDHSLSISFGPSGITSKMYTPSGKYSWRTGMELMAEYDCVFSKGFGFGVTYTHNHTSYPHDTWINQNYIGPSFVYAGYFGEKWWAKAELGLGYANCDDGYKKYNGIGSKSALSLHYMVTPKIGIGAHLLSISSSFGKQSDGYPGNKNDVSGIARIGLTLGFCIHL